jgi:predicted amidohydrolase
LEYDKYYVAAIQTANPNARNRREVKANLNRCIELIDATMAAYPSLGFPIKLIAFPEHVIQGFSFMTAEEYLKSNVPVTIPGEESDKMKEIAQKYDIYIVTGSWHERDPEWPKHLFNTVCVIGPKGIELKYRKVNPWIPLEFCASPHSLEGYKEELFPVADLPIGKIGCAICYDFIFPETIREMTFKGAEVIVRVSAYMLPWGWDLGTNWWTIVSQVRSLENVVYGVHVNQGASIKDFPPFTWAGGTCVIDYEGKIIAQSRMAGEQVVIARINLDELRDWRAKTYTHLMPVHLRAEAYTYWKTKMFPAETFKPDEYITYEKLLKLIDQARRKFYPKPKAKKKSKKRGKKAK